MNHATLYEADKGSETKIGSIKIQSRNLFYATVKLAEASAVQPSDIKL